MPLFESMLLSVFVFFANPGPSAYRRDMPKDLGSNPSECHIFVPLRSFFLC